MMLANRHYVSSGRYRFGFNGKEMDDEWNGEGNMLAFKYRIHDVRLGRFLSIDPLAPEYPWNSTYAFSEDKVLAFTELGGLETKGATDWDDFNEAFKKAVAEGQANFKRGAFFDAMGVNIDLGVTGGVPFLSGTGRVGISIVHFNSGIDKGKWVAYFYAGGGGQLGDLVRNLNWAQVLMRELPFRLSWQNILATMLIKWIINPLKGCF